MSKVTKEIGKITSVRFGRGGYQDAMTGYSFQLGGKGWGVSDFWGSWTEHDKHCKWALKERDLAMGQYASKVSALMSEASVEELSKLKNVPVEVTFEGQQMKSWRILTEVL